MKFILVVIVFSMLCVSGLEYGEKEKTIEYSYNKADFNINAEEEVNEVEIFNRKIIANALGISEDARSLRTLMNALDTIDAGKIQKAVATEIDGDLVLDVVAENNINYRFLLSDQGNMEAVLNLDTGEWLIRSVR